MDIPSVDDTSFMAKFLSDDEEQILQSWTPTFVGASITVRYFIYTRFLFENLPYERSQRVINEVRIFKRPEYLFSDMPSGYDKGEDPFTYHNGG